MKRWHILLILVAIVAGLYGLAYARHFIPQIATFLRQIPVGESNADYLLTDVEAGVLSALSGNLDKLAGTAMGGLTLFAGLTRYFQTKNIKDTANAQLREAGLIGEKTQAEGALIELKEKTDTTIAQLTTTTETQAATIIDWEHRYTAQVETNNDNLNKLVDVEEQLCTRPTRGEHEPLMNPWLCKIPRFILEWLGHEFRDYQSTELLHQRSLPKLDGYPFTDIRPDLYHA
jgi:hypothetical protein